MNTYTVICLRDGVKRYEMRKVLTSEETIKHFIHWGVYTWHELLQRWNSQPESKVSKLKWFYF